MPAPVIPVVIARLEARIPELAGRVEGAAQLADLMARKALPQVTPAAHVIPLGLQGAAADAGTGAFTQIFDEVVGIVLTFRTHSQTASRALPDVDAMVRAVIDAVAGWAPDDQVGVFRLLRGNLVSMGAGTVVYQIDFSITDQLRIFS